ncbi:MAG: hypothetical protein RI995_2173 [Bacteroidota bacterium]
MSNKVQFEAIQIKEESSFRILQTPYLQDFYMWHSHPEYELLYIEAEEGPCFVGEYRSHFKQCELVFIGPNVPHLNFDYGVKGNYRKLVVQMREGFLGNTMKEIPELAKIEKLFQFAKSGIRFNGLDKHHIGDRLFALLTKSHFEQFVEILSIFQTLAAEFEIELLNKEPLWHHPTAKDQHRMNNIKAFVEDHFQRSITLEEISDWSNLSKEAFCRYFKAKTQLTFLEYLHQYRVSQAKKLLMRDVSIAEVAEQCGFESLSYFNRVFKKIVGENPSKYRSKFTYLDLSN